MTYLETLRYQNKKRISILTATAISAISAITDTIKDSCSCEGIATACYFSEESQKDSNKIATRSNTIAETAISESLVNKDFAPENSRNSENSRGWIPPHPQKSIEEQIRELWNQTEQLADWIDYSDAPIGERRARVPEYEALTIRIDKLIREQPRICQEKKQQIDFNTAHNQEPGMVNCFHGQSCSFLRGNSCMKAPGQSIFTLNKCPLTRPQWFSVRYDGE